MNAVKARYTYTNYMLNKKTSTAGEEKEEHLFLSALPTVAQRESERASTHA
jgi:hypothetical protein